MFLISFHNFVACVPPTQNKEIIDANGRVDPLDNKYSYGGDSLYFKAGLYNQCSTKNAEGLWYAACGGTGDWDTDKANGDYAQATFSRLVAADSTAP